MNRTRRFACLLVALALASSSSASAYIARRDAVRRTVARGVEYTQELLTTSDGPLVANTLRVDLHTPGVRVQTAVGEPVMMSDGAARGRQTVGALAARHGAIAGVNADYFPFTGVPVGLAVRDGMLLHESLPFRVAMEVTREGAVRFDTLLTVGRLMAADGAMGALDGLNRLPDKDEIVLLTPAFSDRARVVAGPGVALVPLVNLDGAVRIGRDGSALAGEPSSGDPHAPIPAGGALLAGSGRGAEWLRSHVKLGDRVAYRFDVVPNPLGPGPYRRDLPSRAGALRSRPISSVWTDAAQVVEGGPWLVRGGKVAVDDVQESFTEPGFVAGRHGRTAVGVTASGDLLLVEVDGRQPTLSRGMTLAELAAYLVQLGAVEAINLDGGGSSTMVVGGAYVNSPSDGEPRAVAEALLVYSEAAGGQPADKGTTGDPSGSTANAGGPAAPGPDAGPAPPAGSAARQPSDAGPAPVTVRAGERVTLAVPSGAAPDGVFGTVEGTAFVSQLGVLTSTHAGTGTAVYTAGARSVRIPFIVVAGPPARIHASLQSEVNNPPDRNNLVVRVTDAYGNPVPGQRVHLGVAGGMADTADVATDARGRATVEIVWDAETGRRVTVSAGAARAEAK